MSGALDAYSWVCNYEYRAPDNGVVFVKKRYELLDPISGMRSKQFRYYDPTTRLHRKRAGADAYLYRLPELLEAVRLGRTVHSAEGEKDAEALAEAGVAATSHHQGAGRVTQEQADSLRDAKRVVLWVDLDRGHWEVGAYDAVLRHNLLIDSGVPASQVDFVRARTGKDAWDHLQSFGIDDAVPVNRRRLARVALNYTPNSARRLGYGSR